MSPMLNKIRHKQLQQLELHHIVLTSLYFSVHIIMLTHISIVSDLEKEFRGLPSDVDVAVGSSVVLSCQAPKGNPSPLVRWKKDGKVYHVGEGSHLDGDSLVINSVSKKDAGEYQCQAENIAAVRITPTVHLGVHGKHTKLKTFRYGPMLRYLGGLKNPPRYMVVIGSLKAISTINMS